MSSENSPESPTPEPRRDFVASLMAVLVGGIVSLAGLASGLLVFLDPLLRKPKPPKAFDQGAADGLEGYFKITTRDALPADGAPRRFAVIADKIDAWNFTPGQPIGALYLRRLDDQVIAFQATCPHAGCSVSPSPDNKAFFCPCHNSSFDLDGEKVDRPGKQNPSPRPMDRLEVHAEKLAEGEVWVKYLEFYTGREEQKAKNA